MINLQTLPVDVFMLCKYNYCSLLCFEQLVYNYYIIELLLNMWIAFVCDCHIIFDSATI